MTRTVSAPTLLSRALRSGAGVLAALTLHGCVVAPPPARPIDRVDINITKAPPPEVAEQQPAAPAPDAFWVPGHWRWEGPGYVWAPGHWERPRQGFTFVRAWWSNDRGYWVYHPARWVPATTALRDAPDVVVAEPPPPMRVEVMPVAPGPGYFWANGYWRWSGARHVWVAGRWEPYRPGYYWVSPYWARIGINYRFMGGHWSRY